MFAASFKAKPGWKYSVKAFPKVPRRVLYVNVQPPYSQPHCAKCMYTDPALMFVA